MVKNKKSAKKINEVKKSVKKIKELEQKIKENPDAIKVCHNDVLVDIIDDKDDKKVDIDNEIEEILKEAGVSKINIKNENVKIGLDREIDDILSNSGIDVRELENDDENLG